MIIKCIILTILMVLSNSKLNNPSFTKDNEDDFIKSNAYNYSSIFHKLDFDRTKQISIILQFKEENVDTHNLTSLIWIINIVLPKKDLLIAGFYKDIEPYVEKINKYNEKLNNDLIILPMDEYKKELDIISPEAEALLIEKAERKEERKISKKKPKNKKQKISSLSKSALRQKRKPKLIEKQKDL